MVDAAQVLLDEFIHPEKCGYNVRFDTLACSVSHSTPVGADSVQVKQDCRGGLYPSALSAGCDQPAGPWPSLFPRVQ
jgi:hypothetical protein